MPPQATVEIIVKGIALWFKKEGYWNALLPFDTCHTVDFTYRKDDEPPQYPKRSLGAKNGKIKIYQTGVEKEADPGETTAFKNQIFDLTNTYSNPKPYTTHGKIKKKDDWYNNSVYLRLGGATLSVFDYVQDMTHESILIHGLGAVDQRLNSLAHWVRATIIVPAKNELHIEINGVDTLAAPIKGDDGGRYEIVINNDCEKRTQENDMLMYYKIIDSHPSGERFWIGDRKPVPTGKNPEPKFLSNVISKIGKLEDHKYDESDKDAKQNLLDNLISKIGKLEDHKYDESNEDPDYDLQRKSISDATDLDVGVLFVGIAQARTGGIASLVEGKPCMNVKVTDETSDLPSFP